VSTVGMKSFGVVVELKDVASSEGGAETEGVGGTGVDSFEAELADIILSDSEYDSGEEERDLSAGTAKGCSVLVTGAAIGVGILCFKSSAVSVSTVMTVATLTSLTSVLIESVEGFEVKLGLSSKTCLNVAEDGGLRTVELLLAARNAI
jgi:hypothetical protein